MRPGVSRSRHQTSTISHPSARSAPRRRASRCWASGVACHRHDWHSIPILRRGSARSSSAIRIASLVANGILVDESDPSRSRTLRQPLEPAARGRRPSRSSSSINSAAAPAVRVCFQRVATSRNSSRLMAEAQRAVECPRRRSEPGRRRQERQRGGHGQDADRVDLGQVGCIGQPAGEMGDRAGPGVRPPALAAQHVDEVVAVEAVEPVESRRCTVGDRGAAGRENGLHRSLVPRARRRRRNQHSRRRAAERHHAGQGRSRACAI